MSGPFGRRVAALAGFALALAMAAPRAHAAVAADSVLAVTRPSGAANASAATRFTRRDATFGLAAAGAVALVATRDRRWSARASADSSRFVLDLAADARRLGDPVYVTGALLAADGLARLTRHDHAAAAAERIALSVAAAGAVSFVVKESAGRWRPDEAPGDPGRFDPFSRHDSFPSGHVTVAFALVAALDGESASRWVPALGYPAAALTAWSRVRDRRHWPSDVLAGAAVGGWVAARTDAFARHHWPRGLLVAACPRRNGVTLAVATRF